MPRTILVTGATGLMGHAVAQELRDCGDTVRLLVRDLRRAAAIVPDGCALAAGDLLDPPSLRAAVAGCDGVFHCAGLPEQWRRDPADFERVNVGGTAAVLDACRASDVPRLVYTSTIDVFAARPGRPFDESELDPEPKATAYERSKHRAQRLVEEASAALDVVTLHPAALYGAGPAGSPGVNGFVRDVVRRRVPMLLPGGMPLVTAANAARGHVLAFERGRPGDRYILSEGFHTLVEIARRTVAIAGRGRVPPVMPGWVAAMVSTVGERVARWTGRPPLIPRGQLHFLRSDLRPDASKAERELGWRQGSLDDGLRATIGDLRRRGEL